MGLSVILFTAVNAVVPVVLLILLVLALFVVSHNGFLSLISKTIEPCAGQARAFGIIPYIFVAGEWYILRKNP